MTKGPGITVVVALLAVGVAAQPYLTVHQMHSAAERRDGAAFSEYIDFPSVRQSLKDQINAAFLKEMTEDESTQQSGAAALGAAVGGFMVDRMADAFLEAYVTPAGITQMMAADQPGTEGQETGDEPRCRPMSGGSMSYESLNKFVVSSESAVGGECKVVLRRQGVSWKVTEIILQIGQLGDDGSSQASEKKQRKRPGKSDGT